MARYLFEYVVIPENKTSEFSIVAESEDIARNKLVERVADLEFVDESDIRIEKLLKTLDVEKNYYECEACT
ncbi:hypothetical protein [Tuberibacillus sp. Marseille-P3662]|uniref:hypothetical protein n=1 Tax=Tuberibacillus sp. Marseille-P3662 TaxID=1965358 RepID=UPI000A1CAD05|nr:hypothetical protein [Tuberibacillus sp. Marseille-P3662]